MRAAFLGALREAAAKDDRIVLVAGDLGFSVVEDFASAYPDRFFSIGINEQGAMGLCAGLASQGLKVYYYSIANFATLRCLEQIRNDISYHGADVTIVGVGAGLVYGSAGYTHWAVEDLGAMMLMPRMGVLTPFDQVSAVDATGVTLSRKGPHYLRLGKGGEPDLTQLRQSELHATLWEGRDATSGLVLTHGALAATVVNAARDVQFAGTVIAITEPRRVAELGSELQRFPQLTVIEEVVHLGGLGNFVERELLRHDQRPQYTWRGIENILSHVASGSHEQLQSVHGIDLASIKSLLRDLDSRAHQRSGE